MLDCRDGRRRCDDDIDLEPHELCCDLTVPLRVTLTDTSTAASAMQSYAINIPATVGGNTAYVGFTGATGGATATQEILTWTYAPTATTPG